MKTTLLIMVTIAILASRSKAGLGWTLAECIHHYGRFEDTELDPFTECDEYHFKIKDFEITAILNKPGNVIKITYFSHLMSEEDVGNLLAGNAPKAEWRRRLKEHTISLGDRTVWDGFEDGSRKYSADYWTINYAGANINVRGTKVLEVETSKYEDLQRDARERRAKSLREM